MSSPFLDLQGVTILESEVIGQGSSAVVVLRDGYAVKMPLRYLWSSDVDIKMNVETVQHEQDVYRRLQSLPNDQCDGIVKCIGYLRESTQLAYMVNGDLRAYLQKNQPSRQLQFSWFRDMARTLAYIHGKRVLVADIASRNFLLDSDLRIKFCDFSEATVLPLGTNMGTADDNGYSARIDIGLLGAVIYEVVTGQKFDVDLFQDNLPTDGRAHWPERSFLPRTDNIWLSWIIEGCWNGRFQDSQGLLRALNSISLYDSGLKC